MPPEENQATVIAAAAAPVKQDDTPQSGSELQAMQAELDKAKAEAEAAKQQAALVQAKAEARQAIAASDLPAAAKTKLASQFDAATSPMTKDAVAAAIKAEGEYLASLTASAGNGVVKGLGAQVTEDQVDKTVNRIDAFFDPAHKDHRHAQSLRALVQDSMKPGSRATLLEAAASGDFASLLFDGLNKRMVAAYNGMTDLGAWRNIAQIVPVTDYKSQKRLRWGGFGNLPVVAEDAAYPQQTMPGDEKVEYTAQKYGGLYFLTEEAIINDDVGALRDTPNKAARAAARTLHDHVFAHITGNGNIYDGDPLFASPRGNMGTAALSAASFAAARLAMVKQTEAGSSEPLGIAPSFIIVPPELNEVAYNLFIRGTNNDPNFIQSQTLQVIAVNTFADGNNWYLAASPMDIPGIEVGFLDGRQEPELLVQNNPTTGQAFTNDRITWKVRHAYGSAVLDYRAFFGAIVA